MPIKPDELKIYYAKLNQYKTEHDSDKLERSIKFFKEIINDEDSEIYEALQAFNEQKKIDLLSCIMSGNPERIIESFKTLKIYHIMRNTMRKLDFNEDHIKRLQETEYEPDLANPGKLLNSTISAFISAIVNINNSPKTKDFEKKKLVVSALQSVPESELAINLKLEMALECGITDDIHPHCNNTVTVEEPELISSISDAEYCKSIQNKKMDYSTFIILSLGLLKSKLAPSKLEGFTGLVDQIHECYFQGEWA